jgi:outer membrane immunogenic protein
MVKKMANMLVAGTAMLASLGYTSFALAGDEGAGGYQWDGAFVGLNAGGAFGSSPAKLKALYEGETKFEDRNNIDAINASGFIGGIGAGYNFSNGPLVFGIEGDINSLNANGRDVDLFDFPEFQNEISTQYSFLGTVRGKIGVANGRVLGYATGGLAVGTFEDFIGGTEAEGGAHEDFGGGVKTRTGYVLGAGVEYAVTEKVSIKGEYLFTDLGRSSFDVNEAVGDTWFGKGTQATVNADHKLNIIRVGLNVRF